MGTQRLDFAEFYCGSRMITGDPERALRNLPERDQMFTELLCEEKKPLGLPAIEIDTTMTENDLTERMTEIFGL
jgi:hypothetical protein